MYLSYFDEPRDANEGAGEGGVDLVDGVGGTGTSGVFLGASRVFSPLPTISFPVVPTGGSKISWVSTTS